MTTFIDKTLDAIRNPEKAKGTAWELATDAERAAMEAAILAFQRNCGKPEADKVRALAKSTMERIQHDSTWRIPKKRKPDARNALQREMDKIFSRRR